MDIHATFTFPIIYIILHDLKKKTFSPYDGKTTNFQQISELKKKTICLNTVQIVFYRQINFYIAKNYCSNYRT